MRRMWILALPAVLLLATGCVATRDWVRENLGQHKSETNQRFTQVEGRVNQESARVGDVEKGLESTGRALQQTQGRADAAFNKAEETDNRLTRLWSRRNNRNRVDSMDVTFGFDRHDLADAAQTSLVALVKELQANPALTVDLTGYADPKGDREYNVGLSQRRVEAVRRFLIQRGIELPRINSVGLGVLNDPGVPDAQKRRVTVTVMVAAD
jgi:outer membrane protein OmpA-like peptidoglycan-associated protein